MRNSENAKIVEEPLLDEKLKIDRLVSDIIAVFYVYNTVSGMRRKYI